MEHKTSFHVWTSLLSAFLTDSCSAMLFYSAFFFCALYEPMTTAWSLSYGSRVTCSSGLKPLAFSTLTSLANTSAAGAVESMQFALMEITKCPPTYANVKKVKEEGKGGQKNGKIVCLQVSFSFLCHGPKMGCDERK